MNQITRLTSSSRFCFQDFAAGLQTQSVILADEEQFITWANAAALQLHGVDEPEQLGATISDYAANFRLNYIEPSASPTYAGGHHVALCEGALHLAPAGDEHATVRCRMHLFEIVDPVTGACSTAMILRPEGIWSEAIASRMDGQPRISNHTASVARTRMPPSATRMPPSATRMPSSALNIGRAPLASAQTSLASGELPRDCDAKLNHEMIASARRICAVVPIPLHVLDAGMRILCVTDAWLNWLGYSAASVIGRDIGLFVDSETRIRFEQQAWARLRDVGFTDNIRCRFVKRSGEAVDTIVAASASVNEAGELAYTTCVPVEIESHQHDDGLLRLIKSSPIPTLCWQLDTLSIRECNQAFQTLMGHPANALLGQNLDDLGLWETKAARHKAEQALALSGVLQQQDLRLRTSKGEVLTCAVSASVIRLSGHTCGVMMLQDMTDRRRDEAQLCEAIEAVMKDSSWFSRTVLEKLAMLRSPPKTYGRHAELAELTRREREVLTLISVGQCDLDIAQQLGLTRSTVRNHVATLYSKIDVHSRSAAIVWARERGINLAMSKAAKVDGRGCRYDRR